MDLRLFGLRLARSDDEDTTRSAAGRTAVEAATWAPASLLPESGVDWRAESENHIVAAWAVPPERPEVHLRIDGNGAVRSVSLMRWDNGDHGPRGYIPCGGEVHAERRFGDLLIPSRISVGWWFGTSRWEPFFEATVLTAQPVG